MWPALVGEFLPEAQKMYERLRITGASIMDKTLSSSEYMRSLIGRFRETKEARAEAAREKKSERTQRNKQGSKRKGQSRQ
jgi:hypothetical protein